jgi:hypothetical protein
MQEYDIALSFAGEDREYVEQVALCLKFHGVKVFYDDFERVELWGKDLYTHLSLLYKEMATYVVLFISEHYRRKLWTKHELRSAQARAFLEANEYILPVRFDNIEIPGILPTTGYLDLKGIQPTQLASMIVEKLNKVKKDKGDSLGTDEAYTITPKFDLIISEGQSRKYQNGEGEIWRNFHEINILSKPARKVEIEINKAKRSELKDVLTITFIFGGHYYLTSNLNGVLKDFISEYKFDWISYQDAGRYVQWTIRGENLLAFFPHIAEMNWLKNDFQVPPLWQTGARHGTSDPANSVSLGFTLLET